jgi:hypothetical protein
VPTIKGKIKCDYTFVNNRLQKYSIELPANMVADFQIAASPDDVVIRNGKKVNRAFGSIRLDPGVNSIELKVNSF